MGRGEPRGEKERELRRNKCAIAAGRKVGRQPRCLVSVLTKRGINKPIYTKVTNICTTGFPVHGPHGHRGRLCVTAPSENTGELPLTPARRNGRLPGRRLMPLSLLEFVYLRGKHVRLHEPVERNGVS